MEEHKRQDLERPQLNVIQRARDKKQNMNQNWRKKERKRKSVYRKANNIKETNEKVREEEAWEECIKEKHKKTIE